MTSIDLSIKLKKLKFNTLQTERLKSKIDKLRNSTYYPSTTNLQAEAISEGTRITLADKLHEVADLELEYAKILLGYQNEILEMEKKLLKLEKIEPKFSLILAMYYIDNLTFNDIVFELNYEISSIKRYKREAIDKLAEIW
jgi:hypothetical protein